MRRFLLLTSIATTGVLLMSILVSALLGQWLLDGVEIFKGPLAFEFALRWYLLIVVLAAAGFGVVFFRGRWWAAVALVAAVAALGVILLGDTHHDLQTEWAWVRYPTAEALGLAGALATVYAFRTRGWLWGVFALGFFYAGADEIDELHERIGWKIEHWFSLPHVATDLITVFYVVVGAAIALIAIRYFVAKGKRVSAGALIVGSLLFAFSQFLDTADIFLDKGLRALAVFLSARGYLFSDAWYLLYDPKRFANSLEEILECTAGMFFAYAFAVLVFPTLAVTVRQSTLRFARMRSVMGIVMLIIIAAGIGAFRSAPSPLRDSSPFARIAGPREGLVHSDDLIFHPAFGVLVANEGGGNVFQWKGDVWKKVPDPKRVLRDVDSLTATAERIYVADGAKGRILSSTGDGTWEVVRDRSGGLKRPEAIVVTDSFLVGVDESEKGLFRFPLVSLPVEQNEETKKQQKKQKGKAEILPAPLVEWFKPGVADFRAPEGIVYHPDLKRFIVTDDTGGVIWSIDFSSKGGGKSIERFATPGIRLANPEDIEVLPGGDILFSDNGRGEIVRVASDGTLRRRIRFHRMYHDLQGVTVDADGTIFAVTADAFGSVSFMPSFLWRIGSQEAS